MTYSQDLRKKALEYLEQGNSQKEVGAIFGVSSRTIWNWIQRKNKGILKPKKYEVSPRKIDNDLLIKYIKNHPDAYLREIAEEFKVDPSAIFYACKRLQITLKKRPKIIKKDAKKKEKYLLSK
jgi:transposase